MATTSQKQTFVDSRFKCKVTYEWRSFLGLFGHWREAKVDRIDDDLHIDIYKPEQYGNIYINGKLINEIKNEIR